MVYLRGAESDYDRWAAAGCAGWDWRSVRTAFEELEEWLRPAVLHPHNALTEAMVEAAIQAGFPENPSFDSGTLDGAGWNKSTIANGERFNAYRAFVAPVLDRPNLHLQTGTRVLRLAMEGNRARGVVVQRDDGSLETISAGEVILCAGAFDSPRILLLSGIGPAAQLERLGIAPVADLPVGENLIDHLLIGVVYDSLQPISDCNAYATEGCAFTRSTPDRADCDIQISFAKEPHFAPETHDGVPRFTIIPGITRPRSRGTVCLTAADPDAPLAIDPSYFSHPDDMRAMIRAVRLSREIAQQHGPRRVERRGALPGSRRPATMTRSRPTSRATSAPGSIRSAPAAWASAETRWSIPTLRVHGIAGLRVADASIMPDIVSVNTNAASTMIGWKAGDLALA